MSSATGAVELPEVDIGPFGRALKQLEIALDAMVEDLAYRQARTDTVHTYNETRAKEVAAVAKPFAQEARLLFENLSRRLDQ